MKRDELPRHVAVIGAGPIGLAAAAHLRERGFVPTVFEAGDTIAANLESYRHVRLFSPWRNNIDGAARRQLERTGWQSPSLDELPTAGELRVKLDPWIESTKQLAPLIDPNVHSCGTVRPHGHRELAHPEVRFYAVGAKSYGRAPNFLLATGHEQVRSVAAALASDLVAADDVRLDLPRTGVCSMQFDEASSGCCSLEEPELIAIAEPASTGCATNCGTNARAVKREAPRANCCR